MIQFAIRLGRPSDLPFVVDSWAKRGRNPGERIRDATARARSILAHPSTVLRVAVLPDDEDAILGWAVITDAVPPRCRYVYVRKDARGQGVAKVLLVGVHLDGMAKGSPKSGQT